jgi:hypothetical protein
MSSQAPTGFITSQGLPNPKLGDGLPAFARIGPRRDAYVNLVLPDFKTSADEGSYFTGTNATFGTGVAGPNTAAFSATSAIFTFLNKAGVGGPRTYLDYIRLIVSVTSAAATGVQFGVVTDAIVRGSAGTPVTLVSPNQDAGVASNTQVLYTPTVAAASGSARNVSRASGRTSAAPAIAVGDEYLLAFGSVEKAGGSLIYAATVAGRFVIPMPPVILGPGSVQSAVIHAWFPNIAAAASFEFEVGLLER